MSMFKTMALSLALVLASTASAQANIGVGKSLPAAQCPTPQYYDPGCGGGSLCGPKQRCFSMPKICLPKITMPKLRLEKYQVVKTRYRLVCEKPACPPPVFSSYPTAQGGVIHAAPQFGPAMGAPQGLAAPAPAFQGPITGPQQ